MKIINKTLAMVYAVGISSTTLVGCSGAPVGSNSSTEILQPSSSVAAVSSLPASSSQAALSSSEATVSSAASSAAVFMPSAAKLVYAVNVGSAIATTLDGISYNADRFAAGGTSNTTADAISGTNSDAIYQSERYGDFIYEIPVTNATYTVVLNFVEMYQTTAGARSFNALVEGDTAVTNLDLFSEVGHDAAYEVIVENVAVDDGMLTVKVESIVDNATLSGIGIYSDDGEFIEPPDLTPAASELDKMFLDIDCRSNTSPNLAVGATCYHSPNTQELTKKLKMGGDASKNYKVTLRVRGIWEPSYIVNGQKPLNGKPLMVGGNVISGDGFADPPSYYQQFSIIVASPKQTYWLNNYGKTAHEIYKEDYEATLTIAGGSDVTVKMFDGNDHMIANFSKFKFDGLPPYDQNPTLGQMLRLDVINVELAP